MQPYYYLFFCDTFQMLQVAVITYGDAITETSYIRICYGSNCIGL